MKSLVLGFRQQSGIGKESGKPYSITPSILVGSPMSPVQSDRLTIHCAGLECLQLDITPEVMQMLTSFPSSKFPMWLELDTAIGKRGDTATVLVTGFREAKAA